MKVCSRCIMSDISDPTISFDEKGYCNYCTRAFSEINTSTYFPTEEGSNRLKVVLEKLKREGQGNEFDCLMGISGGLDSSYLAYLGYTWGLRILAVHIDDGYDTEISKSNIDALLRKTGIRMLTNQPDAKQFNALTKAYLKAGVPNIAIPQDNILFAFLYDVARKNKIKYFLSGGNFALECILQRGNSHSAMDVVNIRAIHKLFGTKPIDKLRFISPYRKYYDMKIIGLQTIRPLNFIEYNRDRAFKELYDFCGFEYYGRKHLENILTAFTQLYWLPNKFGVDKRSSHLSSMIVSGQMTRDEALIEMSKPMYEEKLMVQYIDIIKKRLELSDEEFSALMNAPVHQHNEYKTDRLDPILRRILS